MRTCAHFSLDLLTKANAYAFTNSVETALSVETHLIIVKQVHTAESLRFVHIGISAGACARYVMSLAKSLICMYIVLYNSCM